MKRAQAKVALETATGERFSNLFAVLWSGLLSQEPHDELVQRFERGWATLLKAHTMAENLIERTISPDKSDSAP